MPAGLDLQVSVFVDGDLARLPEDVAALIYFVCSEALVNVVRHAEAGHAELEIRVEPLIVQAEIRDDGRGGAVMEQGGGLQGLADRIALARGTFDLLSPAGGPTTLAVTLPIDVNAHRSAT